MPTLMLCPACKHTLEHEHCVRCGQPWQTAPSPGAIDALLAPFAREPGGPPRMADDWPARKRRREILAELHAIQMTAYEVMADLDWQTLAPSSPVSGRERSEQDARPHLERLRTLILTLLP